jgi:hypothetical protein
MMRKALAETVGRDGKVKATTPHNDNVRQVEVAERSDAKGAWIVEAIGHDGELYQAIFAGPNAADCAKEYAATGGAAEHAKGPGSGQGPSDQSMDDPLLFLLCLAMFCSAWLCSPLKIGVLLLRRKGRDRHSRKGSASFAPMWHDGAGIA